MKRYVITAKVVEEITYEVEAPTEEQATALDPNDRSKVLVLSRRTLRTEVIGYPWKRKSEQEAMDER